MTTKPIIMGIVNVTPDSFSDGGKFIDSRAAIAQGIKLLEQGADILDIGGESTRPKSDIIPPDVELSRILTVVTELVRMGAKISIGTRNASTMRACLDAGAVMINDVSALRDGGAMDVVKEYNAKVCLMHMQGTPQDMQDNPVYNDVVNEVFEFLKSRIDACVAHGIGRDKIIVDVGIGFGKTLEHNIELLKNLSKFQELNVDLMAATSRKSFIDKICGGVSPDARLGGSLSSAIYAYQQGAKYFRVHDVFETRQALEIWTKLRA